VTRPQAGDEDQQRLLALLTSLGASDAEIAATPVHQRSALALDLVLRGGRPPLAVDDAAAAIGIDADTVLRFWRALGFVADRASATIPAGMVDAQSVLAGSAQLIGDEATLGLARVVGAAAGRLAEALVDSFRIGFELPELGRGARYSDVVESYVDIVRTALPDFEALILATFRAHLVRVAGGAWAPDVEAAAAGRELAVGFADLVGYTALTRTLSPSELSRLLRRFEDTVGEVVAEHGGRLVKQIGDGAMFAADTPEAGAATACDLAAAFAGAVDVPPVRVGLAHGSVLSHSGDYYGDVVNLAARLVALARPGTVVVSEQVADRLGAAWAVERLPDQALKGFGAPAAVYRLLGPA
jgi:class 3 adenylate cyclase